MSFASRYAFLSITTVAALGLTGCETVKTASSSVSTGVSDFSTRLANLSMDDLNPFSSSTSAVTDADADAASAVMPAAGNTLDNMMQEFAANANGCPHAQVVNDLKSIHQFTAPNAPNQTQSVSSASMDIINYNCATENGSLVLDIEVGFNGKLGVEGRTAQTTPSLSYPYFVAVTDGKGTILAKEIFSATLAYTDNSDIVSQSETIRQAMPADTVTSSYRVLVGFQLSPQELAYNRSVTDAENVANIQPAAGAPITTGPVANDNAASTAPVTVAPKM